MFKRRLGSIKKSIERDEVICRYEKKKKLKNERMRTKQF